MVCPGRGLRRLVWTVQSSRTFQQTKYYCIIHGNRIVNSFFAIISVVKLAYLLSKSDVNTQVRNRSPNLCIQHLIPDREKRDESLFFALSEFPMHELGDTKSHALGTFPAVVDFDSCTD